MPWACGLYALQPDGSASTVLTGRLRERVGFDPSGRVMYHVDSRRRRLQRYRYDPDTGAATDPTLLVEFDDATPDGLCVDAEGCLWVALRDGWRVCRYARDGSPTARVDLPVPRPTAVCLLDGMLLITTALARLTDAALRAAPDSGRIFAAEVDVAAAPTHTWNGSPRQP
ncbi:hypothetical protein GCM10023322_83250 [Rugosimonospora acidiphila]|uniref:SMP-30/Gluconolactonase/LRE-like region domain-containing protein n=1 Tax=Rugosimonospora acidiphila TaxID=556531 RepID=A0ABP9SVJ5_9ACTN